MLLSPLVRFLLKVLPPQSRPRALSATIVLCGIYLLYLSYDGIIRAWHHQSATDVPFPLMFLLYSLIVGIVVYGIILTICFLGKRGPL